MKRLNKKGFTLVELLAVIIILAIVVTVSIPAITNVINDSKNSSLGVAANAAEKYIGDQYSLMAVDASMVDSAFKGKITTYAAASYDLDVSNDVDAALIKAMGFNTTDVKTVTVKINDDDTVCVTVNSIPTSSKFYTTKFWDTTGANVKTGANNKSKSC